MIKVDGKLTSWTDTGRSMILAAQEVATMASRHTVSSTTGGRLDVVGKTAYTEDSFLLNAAREMNLRVTSDAAGASIEL